jgi:tyrosyl-tRNA synthetase
MGKTANGAVWLDPTMLPVFDFWQYWRNTEDADVGKFLRLFTTLSLDEISKLEALEGAELNEAKKVLATQATMLVHGEKAALEAEETARKTFEEGALASNLPTVEVAKADFADGIGILQLLVTSGFAKSNGEARRHIKGGAVRWNDTVVSDETMSIQLSDLNDGQDKLSFGKKRHVLIQTK